MVDPVKGVDNPDVGTIAGAGLVPIQNTLSQKKIRLGRSGAAPVHLLGFIHCTLRR